MNDNIDGGNRLAAYCVLSVAFVVFVILLAGVLTLLAPETTGMLGMPVP